MQYGDLITRSLSIMWRYKYLWLLAILGGADVGSSGLSGNFNSFGNAFSRGAGGAPSSTSQDVGAAFGQFLQDNLGLIVVLSLVVLIVFVGWTLLSSVTTGALVRASAEHDAERPFGFGLAWRVGLGTFWRVLGLKVIQIVWGLLIVAAIATVVVLGFVTYVNGPPGSLAIVIILGALFVLALLLLSIPIGLVFILAVRALVLEERGTMAALGRGFALLRSRLGRVLLVWLIQVGLALAVGFGLVIVFIPVTVLVAVVLIAAGVAGGGAAAIVVAIPLALLVIALGLAIGGVVGSYFSTYWTLAFRRMEIEAPTPVAWPQAPAV